MNTKKNIKLRVKNLIEKYNTKNPYKLCEKLNIDILYCDLGKSSNGFFKKALGNKIIVINENLDEYSKKIVLCHELGHAVLHDTRKINFMKKNFLHYTSELEEEANIFTAELLFQQYNENDYLIEHCDLGIKNLEKIKKMVK